MIAHAKGEVAQEEKSDHSVAPLGMLKSLGCLCLQDGLTAVVHDMLLGALYATSTCVMFGAIVYFAVKRTETFEAAQRSTGPVAFIVKYSSKGESVNLYLRLGLALVVVVVCAPPCSGTLVHIHEAVLALLASSSGVSVKNVPPCCVDQAPIHALFAAMSIGQSAIKLYEIRHRPPIHWPEVFKSGFEISFFTAQTMFILVYHRTQNRSIDYANVTVGLDCMPCEALAIKFAFDDPNTCSGVYAMVRVHLIDEALG
ncbi:unnamed protein product [Mesocestoides corti]|uniref:Uncharacterized protein n=1 Tax=Mesocestoides corti TaxID=53468 RepID=A0A0R3UJ07_MESCO|nr:unnamed protein product [Mesocestoides corti]